MKVWTINRTKLVPINLNKYKINWDKAPSKGQKQLQDFLRPYWESQIILAEMRIPGCQKRIDLTNCNKKIIIEYSPVSHHGKFNKFFHGNKVKYAERVIADLDKMEWADYNGFKFIELVEADLKNISVEFFKENFGVTI